MRLRATSTDCLDWKQRENVESKYLCLGMSSVGEICTMTGAAGEGFEGGTGREEGGVGVGGLEQ